MVLQAIRYSRGELEVLDQLRLPHEEVYIKIESPQDAWDAIQSMQVRGAPAIAIVAALSLAVYLARYNDTNGSHRANCPNFVSQSLKYLVTSRPTAVNLADAARKLEKLVYAADAESTSSWSSVSEKYILAAEIMLVDDVQDNKNIGENGAEWILRHSDITSSNTRLSVLTHCNTGSLATAGYGTALGVIRSLHARGVLKQAFYTETRPYNQGSRLTGYELIHDEIPATLVTDSMAAALLNLRKHSENISCIVVGADRVAANGDAANKIGTYNLAILARFHKVKFLVAAPRTTIDLSTALGAEITIEERSPNEVTLLKGPRAERRQDGSIAVDVSDMQEISTAAKMTKSWNPAFDVTPAELIDGIVTEKGVVEKSGDMRFHFESIFNANEDLAPQINGNGRNISAMPEDPLNNVPEGDLSWKAVLSLKPSQVADWETWTGERRR